MFVHYFVHKIKKNHIQNQEYQLSTYQQNKIKEIQFKHAILSSRSCIYCN